MSKGLDAFNTIVDMFNEYANKPNDIGEFFKFTTACQKVEKALKALDTIKEKKVDTRILLLVDSLYKYNNFDSIKRIELTQEEFDLLRGELS